MRYHVHPNAHAEWGNQSLYFLFFSFRLSYDNEALADALRQAFAEHDITAQVTYELIGRFDLMLRVWLSPARLRAFRATLQALLNPLSLQTDILINVDRVVRHWPWGCRGEGYHCCGPLRVPEQKMLADGPTESTLRLLNDVTCAGPRTVVGDELADLIGIKLIAKAPEATNHGIKLVTLVAGTNLSNQEVDALQGLIARRLDEADSAIFSERSLYRSESNETPFIVMCRVAPAGWEQINTTFYDRIQEVLIGKARTSTYPVMRQGLVPVSDSISTNPPSSTHNDRATIAELLADDESDTLEVKATAFGAVDPWLHGRGPIVESDTLFDRSVLKSVVGFLNASGGTVVVGALEAARYRGLSETVAEALDQFPTAGQYVCVGLIDPSFVEDGWDRYHRRITDLLDSRISDTPVATRAIVVEKVAHLDREFCLIHVEAPQEERWYYATGPGTDRPQRFYVRSGARVLELQGSDADQYKRRRLAERVKERTAGGNRPR